MYFDDVLNDIECDKYINYFESQNNYSDTQVKGSNIIHNSEKQMKHVMNLDFIRIKTSI